MSVLGAALTLGGCTPQSRIDVDAMEDLQTREYDVDKAVAWRAMAATALDLGYGFTVSDYDAGLIGVGIPHAHQSSGSFLWLDAPSGNPTFHPIGTAWIRPAGAGRCVVRVARADGHGDGHTGHDAHGDDPFWRQLEHRILLKGVPTMEAQP